LNLSLFTGSKAYFAKTTLSNDVTELVKTFDIADLIETIELFPWSASLDSEILV
jgi:hypothetical protein